MLSGVCTVYNYSKIKNTSYTYRVFVAIMGSGRTLVPFS